MIYLFDGITVAYQAQLLCLIGLGIALMNFLVFFILRKTIDKAEMIKEEELFETRKKDQYEMYTELYKNFQKLRSAGHEFKNHINCLKYLSDKGNFSGMSEYIDKIIQWDTKSESMIDTNHVIVNAVLNMKYSEAIQKDIVFTVKVNDLSGLKLSNEDVVIMLTNMLNNAIEASEKCENNKYIRIKMEVLEDELILSVENSFSHTLVKKDKTYISTKKDSADSHGIGINNVIKVIEKYNGSHVIRANEGNFLFSVVIPLSES